MCGNSVGWRLAQTAYAEDSGGWKAKGSQFLPRRPEQDLVHVVVLVSVAASAFAGQTSTEAVASTAMPAIVNQLVKSFFIFNLLGS
jgi:hypothetical protein